MPKYIYNSIIFTLTSLVLVVLISLIFYKEFSLLHFINITFGFSSIFILFGLLTFITKKGFFDGITYSFRKLYKHTTRYQVIEDLDEMRMPSETINNIPFIFLITGVSLLFIMIIALLLY
ncbi:DUF3899 domain-containing protein [Litchfieldia alkalitelluris]|uniref:DUF3899 domain-containing protein n=1 Tax=Litchfieldia alkalitelluris TaxID=304268 RepID=UPI0038B22EB4